MTETISYACNNCRATGNSSQVLETKSEDVLSWECEFSTDSSNSGETVFLAWKFEWNQEEVYGFKGKMQVFYKDEDERDFAAKNFDLKLQTPGIWIRRKIGHVTEEIDKHGVLGKNFVYDFTLEKVQKPVPKKRGRKPAASKGKRGKFDDPLPEYVFPLNTPPNRPDPQFDIYRNTESPSERQKILKSMVTVAPKHSEMELFRRQLHETRARFNWDRLLGEGLWDYRVVHRTKEHHRFLRILGERVAQTAFAENELEVYRPPDWLTAFPENKYVAPRKRILIHPNITLNKNDVIPVYSDIKDEKVETMNIPESLTYVYGTKNRIDVSKEKDLKLAMKMAEKEGNLIRCDCHEPKPGTKHLIPCFENKKCPCYKMNKVMKNLQSCKELERAEFQTFKPIVFNASSDPFFDFVGFACSDACACKGKCTNNALYLADTRKIPLEIYRNNDTLGFSLRSPVAIPAGTPFLEFVGEIQDDQKCPIDAQDYAYRLSYKMDEKWHDFVRKTKAWKPTEAYLRLLERMNKSEYCVNPKYYGNAGRTALHSCLANSEIHRVFQKSLSPAHARLVMVSMMDIFPGTPITIDYGPDYVKHQMQNGCLCGTFACRSGPRYKDFSQINNRVISWCLVKKQEALNKKYMQEVVGHLQKDKYQEEANKKVRQEKIQEAEEDRKNMISRETAK